MPTNATEGTADREYHDEYGRELVFQDLTHPVVGAWLIGICAMLTLAVIINVMIRWLS